VLDMLLIKTKVRAKNERIRNSQQSPRLAGKKGRKKGTLPFYNECNVENITLIFILPKKTGTTVIPRLRQ
jgi:hypothetical protein